MTKEITLPTYVSNDIHNKDLVNFHDYVTSPSLHGSILYLPLVSYSTQTEYLFRIEKSYPYPLILPISDYWEIIDYETRDFSMTSINSLLQAIHSHLNYETDLPVIPFHRIVSLYDVIRNKYANTKIVRDAYGALKDYVRIYYPSVSSYFTPTPLTQTSIPVKSRETIIHVKTFEEFKQKILDISEKYELGTLWNLIFNHPESISTKFLFKHIDNNRFQNTSLTTTEEYFNEIKKHAEEHARIAGLIV